MLLFVVVVAVVAFVVIVVVVVVAAVVVVAVVVVVCWLWWLLSLLLLFFVVVVVAVAVAVAFLRRFSPGGEQLRGLVSFPHLLPKKARPYRTGNCSLLGQEAISWRAPPAAAGGKGGEGAGRCIFPLGEWDCQQVWGHCVGLLLRAC